MSKRSDRLSKPEEKSKLVCKQPDCSKGQHSYNPAPKRPSDRKRLLEAAGMADAQAIKTPFGADLCWACGDDSMPWELTRQRDPDRIAEILELLRRERIREVYWRRSFDEEALDKARTLGRRGTLAKVEKRVITSLGKPANGRYDGQQTSWDGDVLFYSQHATATCCRKCFAQWHGVPSDQALDEGARQYAEMLMRAYLDIRSCDIWGIGDE